MADRRAPSLREVLDLVTRSSFSMVIQNPSFLLEFIPVAPEFTSTPPTLNETDILDLKVKSDSRQMVKAARVVYLRKEYDGESAGSSEVVAVSTNDQYLSNTEKEFDIDTLLVDQDDAEIFASRWAFLLERATSDISIEISVQGSGYKVGQVIEIDHPKLYERFGTNSTKRLGLITEISKSILGTSLTLSDLGNSFARAARIALDGTNDFGTRS